MSLEIFSRYSEKTIFFSQPINGFLDHMYTLLIAQMGDKVITDFYIDGAVAKDFQGQKPLITKLEMSVRNQALFSMLKQQLRVFTWIKKEVSDDVVRLTIDGFPVVITVNDYPVFFIKNVPVRTLNSFN